MGLISGMAIAALVVVAPQSAPSDFIPDWTFEGDDPSTDWTVIGDATWSADDGELIGTPGPAGGWLVLDRGLQDFQFAAYLRCPTGCETGVLVRAERQADGGLSGLYIPYGGGETELFALTIDAAGRETSRTPIPEGRMGSMARFAPPPPDPDEEPASGGRGGGGGGGGDGGGPPFLQDEWNEIGVITDVNTVRKFQSGSGTAQRPIDNSGFGPIALYAGGTAEVRYRDVAYVDMGLKRFPVEATSPNFTAQRINPYFYAFSSAAADIDRDGNMDFVSGPFIYYGPDFTTGREFYAAQTLSPSTDFPSRIERDTWAERNDGNWVAFSSDFTGDGWPDVLLSNTSGSALYVNPQGEARRWDVYRGVIPPEGSSQAEINMLADVDADGELDLVYMNRDMGVSWAKPDPADPTGMWQAVSAGGEGTYAAHGIGAGDIDGDGRVDLLNASGWWAQPAAGPDTPNWAYHEADFGNGGAEMAVYDVNGDGLNDVVTAWRAHGFGLNWYEQQRDASGAISFVEHLIFQDFSTTEQNAGGVAFTELHGSTMADIDGDGVQDFVVGKRMWSHHESYVDPDPYGAPVLYAYLTVRDPDAPGGARFEPELINNASGAGSQVVATDMNGDGIVDVITTGALGSFIFFGKPR